MSRKRPAPLRRRCAKPHIRQKIFAARDDPRLFRAKPRNALPEPFATSISSDETNQIIDESSPRSVIYRLASPRRRGTI